MEAALDADGFAALLEVLVSDATRLAREGGVESALYARAPVGFVVNGNAPQALVAATPAEPVAAAPAELASPVPTELASALPRAPEQREAVLPNASVPADPGEPEPAAPESAADLGEPPNQDDPGPAPAEAEDAATGPGTDLDWGRETDVEPPPAVAHDALPPIPSSLLSTEPHLPSREDFAAAPPLPPLAPAFGQDEPDEEITTPDFEASPALQPEPPARLVD